MSLAYFMKIYCCFKNIHLRSSIKHQTEAIWPMTTKKAAQLQDVALRQSHTMEQIDPSTADAFIAERRIGERIKRLRLKRSMGLVELGKHTGLSASFLSQLETGRVVPTLRNLARIAMVFNKDLSYFFEPEAHALFRVHKKTERVRLPQTGVENPSYYFESLAYMVPDRHLDPYYAEFLPSKEMGEARPHVHPGYEFLFVLEGSLEIRHGDKVNAVERGDSVYFDASTPHSYRCGGKTPAVALIVTMHQPATTQPALNLRPLGAPLGPQPVPNTAGVAQASPERHTELNLSRLHSETPISRKA
jgi:transcriptional regulator with XRE-family HTH domain